MKANEKEKSRGRNDKPSGRQAAEQPEHSGKGDRDVTSLHQGQGPDFITQDPELQKENAGVQQLKKMNKQHQGSSRSHMDEHQAKGKKD